MRTKIISNILFTLAFIIYGFIFYCACYYAFAYWMPEALHIPAQLTSEYISGVIVVFTLIIILAYIGAAYVVWGGLRSSPKHSPPRPAGAASSKPTKKSRVATPKGLPATALRMPPALPPRPVTNKNSGSRSN